MDALNFHLDGIVKSKNELTDFDGPLELILALLSRNKIEIKDVQISLILEQYLEHLEKMKKFDIEITSEFLEMASHLTYIKAKTLVAGEEEVEEMEELKNSLEELENRKKYALIKALADVIAPYASRGEGIYVRRQEVLGREKGYKFSHSPDELRKALIAMLGRETERSVIPENFTAPARLVYPIGEKSEQIMLDLRQKKRVKVYDLFKNLSGRSELVASFIAVLELCRSGSISLVEVDGEYVAEMTEKESEDASEFKETDYEQ